MVSVPYCFTWLCLLVNWSPKYRVSLNLQANSCNIEFNSTNRESSAFVILGHVSFAFTTERISRGYIRDFFSFFGSVFVAGWFVVMTFVSRSPQGATNGTFRRKQSSTKWYVATVSERMTERGPWPKVVHGCVQHYHLLLVCLYHYHELLRWAGSQLNFKVDLRCRRCDWFPDEMCAGKSKLCSQGAAPGNCQNIRIMSEYRNSGKQT